MAKQCQPCAIRGSLVGALQRELRRVTWIFTYMRLSVFRGPMKARRPRAEVAAESMLLHHFGYHQTNKYS